MGRRIKEDIILDNKQAAESVALILNGGGLAYQAQGDGSVRVIDQASGKTVFLLQAPVCYDAGGQRLEAAVELSPSGEGTRLRYVLEADALDNAAYPITIDPIVLDRLTSEGVELVNLRPPLSEGDSGQVDEEYLKIGGDRYAGAYRANAV